MQGKFLGVGLRNVVGIILVGWLVLWSAKAVFGQWHVSGVSELVHAL